jgi:hypothetical protein
MHRSIALRGAASLVVSLAILVTTTGAFALTPEQRCLRAKLRVWAKLVTCRNIATFKIHAGLPSQLTQCQEQFAIRLQNADALGPCRFLDNGDSTVTDLDTGLMWEMKTPGNVGDTHTWANALSEHVSLLNGTLFAGITFTGTPPLGGHSDWRMPSFGEIGFFLSRTCTGPCVDPVVGDVAGGTHWSSITVDTDASQAWKASYNGVTINVTAEPKTSALAVRGVRSAFQ